jgi:crotonobetainyl-CoA:carnitine CoA-transferase CaiB-like acyl-CoA transferase
VLIRKVPIISVRSRSRHPRRAVAHESRESAATLIPSDIIKSSPLQERLQFAPEEMAAAAASVGRGVVYCSINCYGHVGPCRERPGWEQLAQAVSGVAVSHGAVANHTGEPQLIPCAPTDYTTGALVSMHPIYQSTVCASLTGVRRPSCCVDTFTRCWLHVSPSLQASFGCMAALARRAREGGSYHVRVSLCQTAMFIQRFGMLPVRGHLPNWL